MQPRNQPIFSFSTPSTSAADSLRRRRHHAARRVRVQGASPPAARSGGIKRARQTGLHSVCKDRVATSSDSSSCSSGADDHVIACEFDSSDASSDWDSPPPRRRLTLELAEHDLMHCSSDATDDCWLKDAAPDDGYSGGPSEPPTCKPRRVCVSNFSHSLPTSPTELPTRSPNSLESIACGTLSPPSITLTRSNPSSSSSTPPMSPSREFGSLSDAFSPDRRAMTTTITLANHVNTSITLPTSTSISSSSFSSTSSSSSSSPIGASAPRVGMRGRWLKTLSTPFELTVPDDHALTIESQLGNLIIPITLPSAGASKRSSMPSTRALTPLAFGEGDAADQIVPIAADECLDGIKYSGPTFGVAAHQGNRASMQDSYSCAPQGDMFCVADGHGRSGHIVSSLAASMLPSLVQTAMTTQPTVPMAFAHAFAAMDAHILKHTSSGGSTALVAHLAPTDARGHRTLHVAHVGDSRAVLSTGRVARALTTDHKPELADERAAIVARGGTVTQTRRQMRFDQRAMSMPHVASGALFSAAFAASAPNGGVLLDADSGVAPAASAVWRVEGVLNLSRSLGDAALKSFITSEPSVLRHDVSAADEFLLLATDGVWNVLDDQEAVDLTRQFIQQARQDDRNATATTHEHSIAARAADHLTTTALQRGSTDNVLAIVVMLGQ